MPLADIGVIGLAVMGQNLALNIEEHGFHVAVFNRNADKTQHFLQQNPSAINITGHTHLTAFVLQLRKPRKIILMVKAGNAVDEMIAALLPHLDTQDIIIDGGNSHYLDSLRRLQHINIQGFRYIATGISGGEEGARFGPSIMPGGDGSAWTDIQSIFESISAKYNDEPCCTWIGPEGSGHFVKMVHNGIEYGDMQLIAEVYQLLRHGAKFNNDTLANTFSEWNKGELDSYLIDITSKILSTKTEDDQTLVDLILDCAEQKGTGKWTVNSALDNGCALSLITEAVFSRALSTKKEEREAAALTFNKPNNPIDWNDAALQDIHDALYCAKIISYAQGFALLQTASINYQWPLKYHAIANIWRNGCIIRSRFLNDISFAYLENAELSNLMMAPFFSSILNQRIHSLRKTLQIAISNGISMPSMSAALSYFDSYSTAQSPANLIQAQRDFFGSHGYERVDRPRGEFFHTDWLVKPKD